MRAELLGMLGADASLANAALRAATRDGRLHPGLAPPVSGPTVNSEAKERTPPAEIARMMNGLL